MKRLFLLILAIVLMQCVLISHSLASDSSQKDIYEEVKTVIEQRIDLLNEIIKDPRAASMKNWYLLANPHDESELMFFMNKISDGTVKGMDSAVKQSVIEHSKKISDSEESVLLSYLRLSMMAFNLRSGAETPLIKISDIEQNKSNPQEYIARGSIAVYNASGQQVDLPAKIIFERYDYEQSEPNATALQKIIIDDKVVYGWW